MEAMRHKHVVVVDSRLVSGRNKVWKGSMPTAARRRGVGVGALKALPSDLRLHPICFEIPAFWHQKSHSKKQEWMLFILWKGGGGGGGGEALTYCAPLPLSPVLCSGNYETWTCRGDCPDHC